MKEISYGANQIKSTGLEWRKARIAGKATSAPAQDMETYQGKSSNIVDGRC